MNARLVDSSKPIVFDWGIRSGIKAAKILGPVVQNY